MHVEIGETSLVVIDRPVVERVFGLFSSLAGGSTAWICLRLYQPGGDWGDVVLALLAPFLGVFALTGGWRVLTLSTLICRVDAASRRVELTRRAPFVRRDTSWRFDDIADIRAGEHPGGGDSAARLLLVLRDGRRIALSRHGGTERAEMESLAVAARRIMSSG